MSTTRFHDGAADVDALYASLAAVDPQSLWTQSGLLTPTPGQARAACLAVESTCRPSSVFRVEAEG
jgi:hypothetical protein